MSVLQQSSKAQDRPLGTWYLNIKHGMIKLPRFQRFEAWDRARIVSFLNTIVNNLPIGVALTLEVAGKEEFVSRYIATAPETSPNGVTQHLLDGQQRLTSFWRAAHNNYEDETYFIYHPSFDLGSPKATTDLEIRCVPRWLNKQKLRMPRWADDEVECLERGLVPISLLRPEDISAELDGWLGKATKPLNPDDKDPDAAQRYELMRRQKNE